MVSASTGIIIPLRVRSHAIFLPHRLHVLISNPVCELWRTSIATGQQYSRVGVLVVWIAPHFAHREKYSPFLVIRIIRVITSHRQRTHRVSRTIAVISLMPF